MADERATMAQAQLLVDAFIMHHRAPAIPTLIAACVGWAVEHGAADLVRQSLRNAIEMSVEAEKAWKDARQ